MPQLDIGTFYLQFVTTIFTFVLIYSYTSFYLLPDMTLSIMQRQVFYSHLKRRLNLGFSFLIVAKLNFVKLNKVKFNFFNFSLIKSNIKNDFKFTQNLIVCFIFDNYNNNLLKNFYKKICFMKKIATL